MSKNLRLWVDGRLQVDTVVHAGQIDLRNLADYLPDHCQKIVTTAANRGQPWRLELGDQDADVADGYWLG